MGRTSKRPYQIESEPVEECCGPFEIRRQDMQVQGDWVMKHNNGLLLHQSDMIESVITEDCINQMMIEWVITEDTQ